MLHTIEREQSKAPAGQAKALLCGGGDLNTLRCFRNSAIATLVLTYEEADMASYSRYAKETRIITSARKDAERMVQDLIAVGRELPEKPVLFYGDDLTLRLISRQRERLAPYFRFLLPDAELIEDVVDKKRFAALAARFNLPVPRTATAQQIRSAQEAAQYFALPVILKPNSHVGWFQSQAIVDAGGRPQKVLRANTWAEFTHFYEKIRQFTDDFVIQEYIPGGDDCIYSFHAYFNQNSEPLAYFVGKKIRTYPKDSGISTYLELVKEPEVVNLGLDILKKLNFVGPAKIDFKLDCQRQKFFMLEINARFSLWNYLGAVSGVNLPQVVYAALTGQPLPLQNNYRTGVKWLSFGNDMRAVMRNYIPDGDLTWWSWLRSYRGENIYDIFAWDDPLPYFAYAMQEAKMRLGKLFSAVSKSLFARQDQAPFPALNKPLTRRPSKE